MALFSRLVSCKFIILFCCCSRALRPLFFFRFLFRLLVDGCWGGSRGGGGGDGGLLGLLRLFEELACLERLGLDALLLVRLSAGRLLAFSIESLDELELLLSSLDSSE